MIILGWNRDHEEVWPLDEFESDRLATSRGESVDGGWSVGNHVNIPIGTECFMLIQGQNHPRGLVARGVTTSVPTEGEHWDDPDRTTNYIELKWQSMRSFMDPISPKILDAALPGVPWLKGLQGSGFPIKPEYRDALIALWESKL